MEPPNVIDVSMKALIRERPAALLRLARVEADPASIRLEDTSVNLPELRADHVLILEDPAAGPRAVYLEYQLQPDPELLPTWFAKCAGLTRQLAMPVTLLVIYLERGDRATFPDSYRTAVGGLQTTFSFSVVRLWEQAERIRSGELAELAPLLVLCEDIPTEQTIRREIELIRTAPLAERDRADLLALAIRIAGRRFSRDVLAAVFREELPMAQGATIVDDWIAEGVEQRLAEREAQIRAEARTEVRVEEARRLVMRLLEKRFGPLPPALVERVENADVAECERLMDRALEVENIADLDSPP